MHYGEFDYGQTIWRLLQSRCVMLLDSVPNWTLRLARDADVPAIEQLIPLSVRSLQAPFYSSAQMDAALGPVFGVDRQLIRDGTFFVAESAGKVVGCGGWSKRKSLFGGDQGRTKEDDGVLDPACDPARVRAFFVHPTWARRGIGRGILAACEEAITAARFARIELVATLAGEPLYASASYSVVERYKVPLPNGLWLPVIRMAKQLRPAA